MTALIGCPDCGFTTTSGDEFVAHREREHPPTLHTIAPAGIESQMAFGTDPKE